MGGGGGRLGGGKLRLLQVDFSDEEFDLGEESSEDAEGSEG